MKKCYISSVLLLCTFVFILNLRSFAQILPIEGDSTVVPFIIGGTDTNISAVPWQVLLEVNGVDHCGGTIIAPNWILTACHCLEDLNGNRYGANQLRIYAGVTRRSQKVVVRLEM
ncbi:MAG: trypsin-like serine protease [Cyclobacteriaceae bacterium]